jgi:hypothetical protein
LLVAKLFFVARCFLAAKTFFVTGTIIPIPIPCAGLIFVCSEVWKGVPNADAEWGWCCAQLLVTRSECVQ